MAKLDLSDFVVIQHILLEGGLCIDSGNKTCLMKAILLREEVTLMTKEFISLEEKVELVEWRKEISLTVYKIK